MVQKISKADTNPRTVAYAPPIPLPSDVSLWQYYIAKAELEDQGSEASVPAIAAALNVSSRSIEAVEDNILSLNGYEAVYGLEILSVA